MARLKADAPFVHPDCEITNSTFGAFTEVHRGARILNSQFDDYAYCDRYADIANAYIGKFANIASFSRIGATDHPLHTAACHHFLYRSGDYWDDAETDPDFMAHRASRRAHVGNDTWIGHGAMIKPEVRLGHGAVVAAGAVVTKDVAPYTIVAGTPAAPMRDRLPADLAERVIALAWWDWDHARLRAALMDFRALKVEAFLEKYGG
ncbi:chloramphenicol acetyltransferase [Tropicimonas sp. S265A]|uniref:chloramphenicol acetyltransferase n=1 Tax=Tropicimonas sp. S265A TaxID=3415134 RepID=UPI003C7DEDAC